MKNVSKYLKSILLYGDLKLKIILAKKDLTS